MKNQDYFGLGLSEKEIFRTLDNGKTWTNVLSGLYNSIYKIFGRIILASSEDRGLLYSDDNGITIIQSNITKGNWGNITFSSDLKRVYASSADSTIIVRSTDNGETWKEIMKGDDGKFYDMVNGNFVSKNILIDTDENVKLNIPKYNLKDFTNQQELLLYILNNIIAPKLFLEVTGKRFDNNSKSYTMLKNKADNFYVNLNKYINKRTLLDFEEDVGMKPFYRTIDSIISDNDNLIIHKDNSEDTDKMKDTMMKVRKFLAIKKRVLIDKMVDKVVNTKIDNTNLLNVQSTQQDRLDAIEMEEMYENITKGSVMTIMSNVYENIFNLPDSKIRELIFAAIYEDLNKIAPSLNFQLGDVLSKCYKDDNIKDLLTKLKIKYSFKDGIEIAIDKYLRNIKEYIKKMSESEDEDLKNIAVQLYKENRFDYIQNAENFLYSIYTNANDFVYNTFEKINDCILNHAIDDSYIIDIKAELEKMPSFEKSQSDNLLEHIYRKLLTRFQNFNINFKYMGDTEKVNIEDISRVNNYIKDIEEEFKKRCCELFCYSYENFIDKEELSEYINKYINKSIEEKRKIFEKELEKCKTKEEAEKYCKENTFDLDTEIYNLTNKISVDLKEEWKSNKEII